MTEPKKPTLRRRGFLGRLLAGAGAAAVARPADAAAPAPIPAPPGPPVPPRIPAAVIPWDGAGDLILRWHEPLQSHEDLPESPEEGDAYFIKEGPYADVAFVAIGEPEFSGWVPLAGALGGNL